MASLTQGFAVAFNGVALAEVYSVTWQKGGGMPTDRSGTWSDSLGTFSVEAFAPISASYGQRGTYNVGGLTGSMHVCGWHRAGERCHEVFRNLPDRELNTWR